MSLVTCCVTMWKAGEELAAFLARSAAGLTHRAKLTGPPLQTRKLDIACGQIQMVRDYK